MRKKILLVVIVLALLVGVGAWFWAEQRESGALVLYGNVDIREVALAFRQPGRLTAIHVEEGDTVVAGALLAELDAQPLRDGLAAAEAQLAQAKANLAKLEAGARAQEVQAARATVNQARAVLQQSDSELARQQQLNKTLDTSQKDLDAAAAARAVAAAKLEEARQQLSLLEEGTRAEDIAAAKATVAAGEAQVAIAQTALQDARLIAPSEAVVLSRVREPGSMVNAQTAVLTLSLRHPTYVRAYVSEPDLARIAPGGAVLLRIDGSDKTYHGTIGFISPRAEFTPKSVETPDLRTDLVYRIRITVSDDDAGLKQGMPVTVVLDTGHGT